MGQVSFDEEKSYGRVSRTAQKGSVLEPVRSFLVSSGIPASSVDYVLLAGVGVIVLIAGYFFVSASSTERGYIPPAEEIERMNAVPMR